MKVKIIDGTDWKSLVPFEELKNLWLDIDHQILQGFWLKLPDELYKKYGKKTIGVYSSRCKTTKDKIKISELIPNE